MAAVFFQKSLATRRTFKTLAARENPRYTPGLNKTLRAFLQQLSEAQQ